VRGKRGGRKETRIQIENGRGGGNSNLERKGKDESQGECLGEEKQPKKGRG